MCGKHPEWFRKAVRNGLYFRGSVPRSVVDEWFWKAERHSLRFNAEGEALAEDLDQFRDWFEELEGRTTEKKAT